MTATAWESGQIKDLPIQIIDGDRSSRYPKRRDFQKEGVLFLNTTNIINNRLNLTLANFITQEKFDQIRKGRLQHLDIVMTTRGSIGKLALFQGQYDTGLINAQMLIMRVDGESLDAKFLFYLMCGEEFQAKLWNFSSGAAQPQIPITDLRDVDISLPPLPIQRKIAGILSAYDDLIESNLRRIKILEQMAQAVYREWFVNFRFPGHQKVEMVDSEFGPVPQGWEVKPVEECYDISGGGTPSKKVKEYWTNGDINWFVPSDLTAAKTMFMDKSGTQINEFGLRKSSAHMFSAYSVMLTSRATIGVVSINTTPACTNQGFITCISNDRVPLYYLYFWVCNNTEIFLSKASGTTFKEIIKRVFKTLPFLMPPKPLLDSFQTTVQPLAEETLNLQRKNTNLRRTRDLLLPRLISGKLDVAELDINTGAA